MWSGKPNTPLRIITLQWVLRGTNYTIRQRIDARHAFNYQGIWTKIMSPLQFSLDVPLLLQVDVLPITKWSISKQLHLSWRPQVYNEWTQLYWYYICFSHLLTFMSPKTHMTPLEHKRRNFEESLLLGVLLHRMWMRKKKKRKKTFHLPVHSTCVLWNLLCIFANLAFCIWFRGTWEHC